MRIPEGFSLLELVIGMFIFAVGMLALASLQGQLTRSQMDAAVRSVATNIAEEQIEMIRGFGLIEDDPANSIPAYEDMQTGAFTVSRGSVDYVVVQQVTDYYYDPSSGQFSTSNPEQLKVSDFKDVSINVSWGATPGFRISAGNEVSAAAMGTGRIQLAAVISSVTTQGAARSSTQGDTQDLLPDVDFTPGENPDIISLQLGPTRFKESTLPLPRVYRSEERVETRFDVITYSQVADDAMFLRREEFIAVSCDCELRAPAADCRTSGRLPTTWAADEYARGEFAIKPSGVSASNQQSIFCDECCRDHHDGAAAQAEIRRRGIRPVPATQPNTGIPVLSRATTNIMGATKGVNWCSPRLPATPMWNPARWCGLTASCGSARTSSGRPQCSARKYFLDDSRGRHLFELGDHQR